MAGEAFVGIVFIRSKQVNAGFSETYPLLATTFTAGETAMDSLIDIRQEMLCHDMEIQAYRISDANVPGDSFFVTLNVEGLYGIDGTDFSEPPNVCLRIRSDNASLTQRGIRYVRGLPEDCVEQQLFAPTATFDLHLDDYKGWLETNAGLLHKTGGIPAWSIVAVNTARSDGLWTRKSGRPFGLHRGRRATAAFP